MKALLLSGLVLTGASWLSLPERLESWLFNSRERTESGIEQIESGDPQAGAEKLDTAARIAPDDPLTRFNAGTGRLLAERQDAAEELEQAAALAPPDLLPRVLYNLGNAQLAAGDPAAAIESYKDSLRLAPDQEDAKYNLELALQALQEQNSGQGQDQETPEGENEGDEEQSPSSGSEDSPQDQQPQPDGQEGSENQDESGQQPQPEGQNPDQERPLPNFEDQPDMTAEQAAAILEAVENLEREQRQQQAAERLKSRKKGDRDW